MKKLSQMLLTLAAVSALTLCIASTAMAAETPQNTITVNGSGVVLSNPDTATLSLGVETKKASAEEARNENAKEMSAVIAKLKELGIAETDISTSSFRINPVYSYKESGGVDKIEGYTATNMLSVKTSDVDNAFLYLDSAVKAGANINYGIEFSIEDSSALYGDALQQAVKNAGISAKYIANAMGVTLGSPVNVIEESRGYAYSSSYKAAVNEMAFSADAGGSFSTPISYDKIEITANITMIYSY